MASALRLSLLLLLLGALACAPEPDNPGDGDDTSDAGDDTPDGGDEEPKTELIGPEGGTVTANGVTLTIPPGALTEPVEISIDTTSATPPQDVTALSSFYEFGPAGTQFLVPATVTITGAAALPAGAKVYWSRAGGAPGFDALSATVVGLSASAQVSHFSVGFIGAEKDDGGDGTCSQQEEAVRNLHSAFEPFTSLAPTQGPARITFAGGAMFIQYGGGNLQNAKAYGSRTWVSTDGRAFSDPRVQLGADDEYGTLIDPKTGDMYAFERDGSNLAVTRRAPGGCSVRLGTIENAYGKSAPLALLPDGRIFGVVYKRSPQENVAVISADGGAMWTEMGHVVGTMAAAAPTDPSRIYVGQGYISGSLAGLATSRDGGATFTSVRVPSGTTDVGNGAVQSIAVDPANADVVYVVVVGTKGGVYKSIDGGASFPTSQQITIPGGATTLAYDASGVLWAAGGQGLQKRGASDSEWTAVNGGLTGDDLPAFAVGFDGGTLWRLGNQLRKSTDGGQTWTVVPVAGFGQVLSSQQQLTDPSDEKVFYAGDSILYGATHRTADGGRTWTKLAEHTDGEAPRAWAVTGTGTLLSLDSTRDGTDGLRSTDGGQTWTPAQGLDLRSGWNSFGIDPAKTVFTHRSGTTAYVVDPDKNLHRSTDDGATWTQVKNLADAAEGEVFQVDFFADPATSGRVFFLAAGSMDHTLYVSTDAGDTFTKVEPPAGVTNVGWRDIDWDGRLWGIGFSDTGRVLLKVEPGATTVTSLAAPMGFGLSVLGRRVADGLYLSVDAGATWSQTTGPATMLMAQPSGAFVHRANADLVLWNTQSAVLE